MLVTDKDIERFVRAQDPLIATVRAELAAGCKRTHWMWFVFPQLRALGRSSTAQHYGIASLAEAQAYMAHPVLAARLLDCTRLVLGVQGRSVHQIFGSPDDMKFRSSMTLFTAAAPDHQVFAEAIRRYFDAVPDARTVELLTHP